jgi:phage gp46-like protein
MLDDGVATTVEAHASFPRRGWIALSVTIWQGNSSVTFDPMWQLT